MSRIGKKPIPLLKGTQVKVEGTKIIVKGTKGELSLDLDKRFSVELEDRAIVIGNEDSDLKALHGLYRSLVQNLVVGTTQGFEKRLEMIGVGFRAAVQGKLLTLQAGFSHPVEIEIPEGISVQVDKGTQIIIAGIEKQKVGQFAADVRSIRKPEPYKGKGIRYVGEYVRRKAGKSGKK